MSSRSLPPPQPLAAADLLLSLWMCLLGSLHGNGIIHYVAFYVWLLSLNIDIFRVYPHGTMNQGFIPFHGPVVHRKDGPHCVYPLIR